MFAVAAAVNSVQVVNTNANLQSSNNPYYPSRPNNQIYVSGAVRSYQHGYNGYPSPYNQDYYPSQGYRYRRQIGPIVKEANSQYQYQGNNQYDEKVNPLYPYGSSDNNLYPYSDPAYKYRENSQYQLQGNTQSRVEGDPSYGNQYSNNRYQSQQQGSLYRQRYQY